MAPRTVTFAPPTLASSVSTRRLMCDEPLPPEGMEL